MKLALVCASYLALFSPLIHGLPLGEGSTSSSGFFMQVTGKSDHRSHFFWHSICKMLMYNYFYLYTIDFHLDPHYQSGSDTSALCHRKESLGDAGKFGALNSKCDSPPILVGSSSIHIYPFHFFSL